MLTPDRKKYQEENKNLNYTEIAIIKEKGYTDDRVYLNMNFLGLDLSKVPMQNLSDIKVLIIPILYVITTFINIKIMTNLNNAKSKNTDKKAITDGKNEDTMEEQLQSMQQMTNSMNYMMPIMSIAIAVIAPLGLSLYWLVKNILQLIERLLLNKFMNKEEA